MHRTLLHAIGLGRDDVDVNALVKDVESCVSTAGPITLTFGRPAIGPFAVELSGWPGCPFTALVDAVTQATARTGATFLLARIPFDEAIAFPSESQPAGTATA
ncbi:hypothetical protein ACFWB1_21370 [Streptomyces goshikiensis]|uniref:hypothetical protein n=1 Tax=Streptomyces goshikiensis TaxID=1942 RepID=UPI0036CEF82D